MNYHALLLVDKNRKYRNNKSLGISNSNQYSFTSHKINNQLNTHENQKYKKCFSVKPSLYSMPKDILLKDLFQNSMKNSKKYFHKFIYYNTGNNSDVDRKYIFNKIKKFIVINNINHKIFSKTIFLYDYILLEKERLNKKNSKYSNFFSLSNLSIALIAFILIFKFNNVEKKMISLKKFVKYFEEKGENIRFDEVCEMEIIALQMINYNLTFLTPFSYMELFLINGIIFNDDNLSSDMSFSIYELVNETLENVMVASNEYFKYNFFYLCCSTVMYVREKYKIIGWPKSLEITFNARYELFNDIYNYFYAKNNKKEKDKKNIKGSLNTNIINITNLKSMSNIINVLKIIKSADKYKKTKEIIDKTDLLSHKDNKEEKIKDEKNNENKEFSSTIRVGINNKWLFKTFKSTKKNNVGKYLKINSSIEKIEENNKNKEIETKVKSQIKNEKINESINNENHLNITEKNNSSVTKSVNRYRKNGLTMNKINQQCYNPNNKNENNKKINDYNKNNINLNNNSNIDSCLNNINSNSTNVNFYKKRRFNENKGIELLKSCPEINKELKNNSNNNYNNNVYNYKLGLINKNNNNIYNKGVTNRYCYYNFKEKRRNLELNKNNDLKITQTSFNDLVFRQNFIRKQNINNDTDNENFSNTYKNKEENSNAPTCESSNLKLSLNDHSIRRSYRYKNNHIKNEETEGGKEKSQNEGRKVLEKNKSFSKLLNNKISFSDNASKKKTGVRKYYKQKKTRDYQ